MICSHPTYFAFAAQFYGLEASQSTSLLHVNRARNAGSLVPRPRSMDPGCRRLARAGHGSTLSRTGPGAVPANRKSTAYVLPSADWTGPSWASTSEAP